MQKTLQQIKNMLLYKNEKRKERKMLEVIEEAVIDSVKLVPFLFITYLIMEYIEHKTGNKTKNIIKKSGML